MKELERTRWLLETFQRHQDQDKFFTPPTPIAIEELANDMAKRGQRDPVIVQRNGRLLDGHTRLAAARFLGWKDLEVVVVEDLTLDDALEELLLSALMRKNLDRLTQVRCYAGLRDLDMKRGKSRGANEDVRFRDRLAARLGFNMTGRHLDRLLKYLTLERPIQDALSTKQLTYRQADMILDMKPAKQKEIVAAFEAGEPVQKIVHQFQLKPAKQIRKPTPTEVCKSILNTLAKSLPMMEDQFASLDSVELPQDKTIAVLDRSIQFLNRLKDRKVQLRDKAMQYSSPLVGRRGTSSPSAVDKMSQ